MDAAKLFKMILENQNWMATEPGSGTNQDRDWEQTDGDRTGPGNGQMTTEPDQTRPDADRNSQDWTDGLVELVG